MANQEYLSKERDLELGRNIQARNQALKELENLSITKQEKKKLENIVASGDLAIEELVKANIGLVYDRAIKFKTRFPGAPDLEDLVQEGMSGMMKAVHKYDPDRGNKFSTVAVPWIIQAIGRGVNKTHRMVRLPENRIADYSRMNKVVAKYEEDSLTSIELDEKIREETGLSQTEILNIRNAAYWHTSLNKRVGSDDNSKELIDLIGEDNSNASAEYSATTNACFEILSTSIENLPSLKQEVLASHFRIELNGKYLDANQVKEDRNLSPSKYRRLLSEGLGDLKKTLSEKDLVLSDFI